MFCEKCGTQNNDNNINCANCGAPLRQVQQQYGYQQGYPQGYPQGYQAPQNAVGVANGPKPTVLYMIAGAIAALGFLFALLPQFTYTRPGGSFSYFIFNFGSIAKDAGSSMSSSTRQVATGLTAFVIILFLIPLAMRIVWAILSFMQKRPAGVFGIIASATQIITSIIWVAMIQVFVDAAKKSPLETVNMTAFPVLLIILAIAGIPVSIIQLTKKKYL